MARKYVIGPGYAEQDPLDWWTCTAEAVKQAVQKAGLSSDDIAGLGLDTTSCTVVVLDATQRPLQPAILWMDMRAAKQAQEVLATHDDALRVNNGGAGPVSAEWMIPKSLWIKQNRPEVYEAAAMICEYQDYINMRLTGRYCASVNNVSIRWHYSEEREDKWPVTLLAALGMSDLLDKWPKEVLRLGEVVGGLTAEAAAALGLPEGLPVAQGGADAFIGTVGLNTLAEGQMCLLTGSSHLHLGSTARDLHGPGAWGTYRQAVIPGINVIEGGQTSTGSILSWFRRNFAPHVSYRELDAEAAAVDPGSEGLLTLEHWQGNRTPHTDPLSKGAIVGLTLKHGRAHMFRSLMEGVAMGTRLVLDSMSAIGYRPNSITVAGGAARSDLWLQIHADVTGLPLKLPRVSDACALGSAVLAAVGAGLFDSVLEAANAMVHVERSILPDKGKHEMYDRIYRTYCGCYPAVKDVAHAAHAYAADVRGRVPRSLRPAEGSSSNNSVKVSASILCADQSRLADETARALRSGVDSIHLDVCDGAYCEALTFGPGVLAALRRHHPDAFFDVHLAVRDPWRLAQLMADAGASQVMVMAEQVVGSKRAAGELAALQRRGVRSGIAVRPDDEGFDAAVAAVAALGLDTLNVMAVQPGFGAQAFQDVALERVRVARERLGGGADIQVDGGVKPGTTAPRCVEAGANVLVVGSALFGAEDVVGVVGALKGVA
ncbi:unnamed protein product [Pedinophyceae sp. YPF-701]|nr:unnamed protein product [Pedinophyceae sp. YPF-701]